jgi:S23 ribosomal protein.
MITNSLVYEKAYSFAIRIVNAYKFLKDKQEFVLSKQLLKAGTSVGANIAKPTALFRIRIFQLKSDSI